MRVVELEVDYLGSHSLVGTFMEYMLDNAGTDHSDIEEISFYFKEVMKDINLVKEIEDLRSGLLSIKLTPKISLYQKRN